MDISDSPRGPACPSLPARGAAWRPCASKASAVLLPPLPLRLLPAGAKVAGWELHPLKSAAFGAQWDAAHTSLAFHQPTTTIVSCFPAPARTGRTVVSTR